MHRYVDCSCPVFARWATRVNYGHPVLRNASLLATANHLHERRALYGESDDIIASAREYEERSHQVQLRQRPQRSNSTPDDSMAFD